METDEFGKKPYAATDEADRRIIKCVAAFVAKPGVARAQVALGWGAQKPFVTAPTVGATKPNYLNDAIAALSLNLTPEEIFSLEEPYVPHPVVGF